MKGFTTEDLNSGYFRKVVEGIVSDMDTFNKYFNLIGRGISRYVYEFSVDNIKLALKYSKHDLYRKLQGLIPEVSESDEFVEYHPGRFKDYEITNHLDYMFRNDFKENDFGPKSVFSHYEQNEKEVDSFIDIMNSKDHLISHIASISLDISDLDNYAWIVSDYYPDVASNYFDESNLNLSSSLINEVKNIVGSDSKHYIRLAQAGSNYGFEDSVLIDNIKLMKELELYAADMHCNNVSFTEDGMVLIDYGLERRNRQR